METSRSAMDVGKLVQIEVESLNYSARAVGRIDGLVVFINNAVPGDRLLARIAQIKKNYAIAETMDILSPSPHRRDPPCVHFTEGCGGCQWQHIAYEYQVYWKKDIVRQALKRIGKLDNVPEIETIKTYPRLHYRNKLRLFPYISSSGIQLGMRKAESHEVVPIRECFISDPVINSLSSMFRGEVFSRGSGLSEINIRSSAKYQQIMLSCTYDQDDPAIQEDVDKLSRIPGVASVFHRIASASGEPVLGYGEPNIKEEVQGIEYRIGPECFFQVNMAGLKALIGFVREFSGEDNRVVLDVHCGVGTFALQVADMCDVAWGTDTSPSAVTLARSNAVDNGITNVHFQSGTLSQTLRDDLRDVPIDTAILDPPRRGCEKADLRALIRSRPKKVVYVSCNPTTLARDLRELGNAGYKLVRLAMMDMFPMTYHLETVALCASGDFS